MADTKTLKLLLLGEDRSASKTIRGVGVEAGKTGSKLDAFGGKSKAAGAIVGGALAAGALVAVDALVQFSGAAIDAASAAQQSLGGVEAVFGKQAGAIKEASAAAAKDLGLSKTAYQELATVLGAGLKNKGIKDFGKETQNLITIGADLAAQYGGDSKTAVEALASAMRGESDPIERYGVSLSESAVKAELAARGQDKLKGKALETAKAAARLAIITKQTADAHGAFGRESDTLAGKQARVAAQYANMQERIGSGLLPMMEKLTQAGMDTLDWMEQNPEVMNALVGAFSAMGDIIVWVAGTLYKALIPSIKNTLTTVAFLTNGLADMLDAISNMPGMEWLKPAAKGMRELATGAAEVASAINKLPPELDFNTKPAQTAADKAKAKIKGIRDEIKALKGKVVTAKANGDARGVTSLNAKIKALRNRILEIRAKADPKGVDGIRAKIALLKGKIVEAKAKGMNPEKVKDLKDKVAALRDKLIKVTARITATGTARWTAGAAGGGSITMRPVAKGAVMDFYANGGIRENHRAQIARAGDWRMWAEPETGGESYIPLAPSKRKDSLLIWAETGRRLGVDGFAGGGVRSLGASSGFGGGDKPMVVNLTVNVPRGADRYAAGREIREELLTLKNGPFAGRGLGL